WSVDSDDDPRTELAEIETCSSMDSPMDYCRISVYAPPAPQPGLLEQAVGAAAGALGFGGEGGEEAFSVQVRGQAIKTGDQITIELTSGDKSAKVMTANLHSIRSSFELTQIIGRSGAQKLADARLDQVYENQSLKQIANDLASQAQVDAGQIEQGSTYSYFVADQSKNLLRQIRELAARDGLDAYFDADNKLTLKKFNKSSADHTFYFGIDIFDLQIFNRKAATEHILVYGESPASNQGSDTWHWIAKDLTPFRSEVGQGVKTLGIQDGAVRTKDAADNLATSKFGAIKDQSVRGRMKTLGNPKVKIGDAIEIKNATKPELNGLFKVISVRHVFNKREGYLTFITFTGLGGAEKAGGLLGGLGGALGL
ncbi:MAG: hypothetical protein L0229_22435, partial [Blastocatellia bacterium]|nr:hypothetical protein [Blastocatellia bacterium]